MATLGDQEQQVLRTVIALEQCTVRQVFGHVGEPDGLAYTTIATVLDRLFAKGLVSRRLDGKVLVYRPTRRSLAAEKSRAKQLVEKVLGADPVPAVATLVEAVEAVDPKLLERLEEEVARRRSGRGP